MLTLVFAATAIAPVALAGSASAHGWVTDPPSRQDSCAAGTTAFDCGKLKYEPQSVEAPKGSLKCSGGNADYAILDDETKAWPRTTIATDVDINWNITARHATASWDYFLDGKLVQTINANGAKPEAHESHRLSNLPEGAHTILARWNVADTINAFYSCLDVNVSKTGSVEPTVAPTAVPTAEPTSAPTVVPTVEPTDPPVGETCDAPAWNVSRTYVGGSEVNHNGEVWKAKWWTVGTAPNMLDATGAWAYVGPCADTTAPTASPTAAPGVTPTASANPGNPAACGLAPWAAANVYASGEKVSRDGRNWEARWWTQGDQPGTTDQWGVWQDLGAC